MSAILEAAFGWSHFGFDGEVSEVPFGGAADTRGLLVFLVEIQGLQLSAGLTVPSAPGHFAHPHFALAAGAETFGGVATFQLSDVGYISRAADAPGVACYLPMVSQPLAAERQLPIAPEAGTKVGATWGEIVAMNPRQPDGTGYWDSIVPAYAVAGRPVRVLVGQKTLDSVRGIWVDPAYDSFQPVFQGVAIRWLAAGDLVRISIRDSLASLEVSFQASLYGGTGGADGTAANGGKPIPKTRGRVLNITPVLIDPTNLIYQWSDAGGVIEAVYERGFAGFTYDGDFPDYAALTAATVAAGHYATCNAIGYLRQGTQPVGPLTIDARGNFPTLGYVATPAAIALNLLRYDAGIGAARINIAAFMGVDAECPYESGIYTADQVYTGIGLLDIILRGIGAAVGAGRDGKVTIFRVKPPAGNPAATYTVTDIVDCAAVELPNAVIAPNWRRTVGWGLNHTVETSNLSPLITAVQAQFLQNAYRAAIWFDPAVLVRYPTATDAAMIETQLTGAADAAEMAGFFGALWGGQRYLYDITLNLRPLALDLGQPLFVQYPVGPLASGLLGMFVGEKIDAARGTIVMRVLF